MKLIPEDNIAAIKALKAFAFFTLFLGLLLLCSGGYYSIRLHTVSHKVDDIYFTVSEFFFWAGLLITIAQAILILLITKITRKK